MSTKNVSFRLDHEMYDCYAARAMQLGFPTLTDYFKSLGRYDLLTAKPHIATGELYRQSADEQANVDRRIREEYFSGATKEGTFFERALKYVLEEIGADRPPDNEIARKIHGFLHVKPKPHRE